jgi:DedD protein
MDEITKRRVVGATVLVAIGVIFIPILLKNDSLENVLNDSELSNLDIPVQVQSLEKIGLGDSSLVEEQAKSFSTETMSEKAHATNGISSDTENGKLEILLEKEESPENGLAESDAGRPEVGEEDGARHKAWVIQFGSFRQEENAVNLLEQLRNRGYAAFIVPVELDAHSVFKVRVGPQLNRNESVQIRTRIENELSIKGILINY